MTSNTVSDVSLPDQNPNPDWKEVCHLAEALLHQEASGRDDTDYAALIAASVLRELYGPHVEALIFELRERYAVK